MNKQHLFVFGQCVCEQCLQNYDYKLADYKCNKCKTHLCEDHQYKCLWCDMCICNYCKLYRYHNDFTHNGLKYEFCSLNCKKQFSKT